MIKIWYFSSKICILYDNILNVLIIYQYQFKIHASYPWIKIYRIIKVFRFQRKTLLFLLGFFFHIIIFFCLTVFVPRISWKRLDWFSWNFHTWYLMTKCYYTFFCFDDVTSGFEISTILWFFIGRFVQIVSPKWVKIDIWNFHGW